MEEKIAYEVYINLWVLKLLYENYSKKLETYDRLIN